MDLQWRTGDSEARFASYVAGLSGCLGHADRVAPMRSYCTGLLLPGGAQERGADGRAAAPGSDVGRAPVAAAWPRQPGSTRASPSFIPTARVPILKFDSSKFRI